MTRLISLFTLFACALLRAQGLSARLEGTVEDPSQARIAGALVTAQQAGGQKFSQSTDAQGVFRLLSLPPGDYDVQVTYPGFAPAARRVSLGAGMTVRLAITLSTVGVSEQVNVSAATELLQPNRATQTVTLTSADIINIPTASRNFTHLIVAEAGVNAPLPDRTGRGMNIASSPGAQGDDGTQTLNPSVNGARPTNNSLSINGLDATNMMNGNGSLGNNISVPLDALDTVEVQTALYSATAGRNGGGNIQLITRSGTNQFHGSAYHFIQNETLNANEFFLNRAGTGRPKFRRNESGVTFGGRVVKDKTFFFGSVQRTDFLSGFANRAIAATGIPEGLGDVRTRETIAKVANDWLASGAAGNPAFAQNFLNSIRAFPAEQIPGLEAKFFQSTSPPVFRTLQPADIHPVAINVLNVKRNGQFLLPSAAAAMPVLPATASFGQERLLQQSFPTFFNSWSGSGSIDHLFSNATRLRLNYIKSAQFVEEAFGWANSSPSPTMGDTPSYTASMSLFHTFSPRWTTELRGGFFELFNTRISKYRDIKNSTLGIFNPLEAAIGGLASLMPTIDISTQRSTSGIGNAWDFFDRQRVINVTSVTSHLTSNHTFQFGGEFRRPTIAGEYMARTNGDLDYGNWVLFFTGHGAAGGGSDLDQGDTRRHFKMKDLGLFFQDDWRIRRGLTLNIGVRYDYYSNPVDTQGRIGNYYPSWISAAIGLPPGFYVPKNSAFFQPGFDPLKIGLYIEPGTPWNLDQVRKAPWDSTIRPDRNNFAPRIGFAWQPGKWDRLVLRGGYGIFYERVSGAFKTDLQLSAPYFIYQNVPAPPDMANPYPRLNVNPFQIPFNVTIAKNAQGTPSWRRFDGSPFPSSEPFSAKNNTFIDPFTTTPYVQQWTFNIQYEPLRGNLLDVRYVGSRGVGLLARLNMAQPQDPRVTPVNGFSDIYNSAGALINPDFFVRPDLLGANRAGGFRWLSNWGNSTYHGLQVSLRRRGAKGLFYNLAYTWAKTLDTISSDRGVVEHDGFNLANNRGPSDFDRTHRFTASYVYQLPAPWRERRLSKAVLGGWSLSGMATLQTGSPFSALGNATRNANWAQPSRVRLSFAPGKTLSDAVKSGRVQDRLTLYYDPTAFTDSLDQWGDTGRNILRGPAQMQWDFMLGKVIPFRESLSAEFRWELYNAFNHPVFANPASTFAANGPGTAGVISSTIGGPRTMQAAFRFRW